MFGESLEDVELAMKMEKVQQFSSQRTDWKDLGESMKRNLKGKSSTLNTDLRLDIIDSCKRLKKEVPLDKESEICPQIQTLAESMDLSYSIECSKITLKGAEVTIDLILSVDKTRIDQCGVNFFGKKEDSPEGRDLINANEMELFREAIYSTQNAVPQAANLNERRSLFRALELIEVWLSRHQKKISNNPTFQNINTHSTGYSVTRKTTRLTRIYYFCDPQCEKRSGRNTFHPEKDLNLPHLEIRLISSDKPNNNFPDGPNSEPFSSKKELPACISLRFGKPMLISRTILIQLQKHMSKHPIVRERVNLYAHTSSFDKGKSNQLVFRTNFPKSSSSNEVYQHRYIMRLESLQDETDSVVSELFLDDIRSLDKVLSLLRTQHTHNILWDSLISTTNKVPWEGKSSIKLEIAIPSPTRFEFKFAANEHLYLIRVEENAGSKKWGVKLIGTDGEPNCPSDVNKSLTFAINQDFNLPTTIQETLKAVAAQPTPDPSDFSTDPSDINGLLSFADKPGQSWILRPRPVVPEIEMTHKLGSPEKVEKEEEKENEDALPAPSFSLMGFWREIEEISPPVQNRSVEAAPQPRNVRIISEQNYLKAFSDLEAFCQINEPVESEEKKPPTTPYFGPASAKLFESSPAPRPGGISQLSPLETARLRMTQTVVQSGLPPGLGPSSADIFDFSDDRSAGSGGSSYPSPAPHIPNPFNFPSVPVPNVAVRGAKTRRPRQRKAGNIGDRTGSTDSNAEVMKKIKMQKPTMMGTVRGARGRGNRKSSGLPPELERPMLQRSYSDYLSQSPFSMATPSHIPSPLAQEDDSDGTDHYDPPSPPKAEKLEAYRANLVANAAALAAQTKARTEQAHAAAQATTLSSLLANDPLEKLRIQPSRKSSYEMLPKKASLTSMPPQLVKNPKTNHISDIYDDGLDSSPPALGAPMVNLSQISMAQLNNSASSSGGPPVLTAITKVDSPLITSSPKTDSVGSNSNDGPPKIEKIEANKIILKIPKQRSSPVPTTFEPTTSSGSKGKTKSDREKSHQKKKEPKVKEPKEEKPKLSREEKQKEKEEAAARKRGRNETIPVPEEKVKPQTKRRKGYIEPTPVVNEPPGSSLPFLQQSLRKNFKIPKKEDKDASKEPITPTTPLAPPLSSPAGPASQPSSSSSSSSFPTAGPIHPPKPSMNNKKNIMHQAAIRLNLPATQPATYLPKNSKNSPIQKSQPLNNRRYSTKEPPERPQVSNIPLPKERAGFVERSAYTGASRWVKAPAAPINKQPPQAPPQLTPRSPSPEAMQVDESSSPEDSLRISEDA